MGQIQIIMVLRECKPQLTGDSNVDYMLLKHWNIMVESFAYSLAKQNSKFNRNRFLRACTYH